MMFWGLILKWFRKDCHAQSKLLVFIYASFLLPLIKELTISNQLISSLKIITSLSIEILFEIISGLSFIKTSYICAMILSTEIAEKIAKSLLQIKAIKLEPKKPFKWASGWNSPI